MNAAPTIRVEGARFAYPTGGFELRVDHLAIARGERVACIGPSGTGKSTLVGLVAGLLVPRSGRVEVAGTALSTLPDSERRAFRLARVGLLLQELELLEYLSSLDNVLLPCHLGAGAGEPERERARTLASSLGLAQLLDRKPARLSQGERQRVALARALVHEPELVLCDEPTGNLDPEGAARVLDLLFEHASRRGATLLVVTHDRALLGRFDRVLDVRELSKEHAAR